MPRPDDPTYDVNEVSAWLDRLVPELAPTRVRHLARGWDHDVFVVNDTWTFRFARHAIASAAIATELPILTWLAEQLPAPIPVIRYVAEIPSTGFACAGHRWLPGVSLCDLTVEQAPEGRAALAPALGRFMRALHAIDPARVSTPLGPDPLARLEVSRRGPGARAVLTELRESNRLSGAVVMRLFAALDAAERAPLSPRSCIVHADLHARNLLVDGGALSGVIDWVDVCRGHPAIDLAAMFVVLPNVAHARCLAEYGEVDDGTLAWAHWRAITYMTLALTGALARGDAAFARECHRALEEMSQAETGARAG